MRELSCVLSVLVGLSMNYATNQIRDADTGADGTARIWDVGRGAELLILAGRVARSMRRSGGATACGSGGGRPERGTHEANYWK